jgi:hypothetical protein
MAFSSFSSYQIYRYVSQLLTHKRIHEGCPPYKGRRHPAAAKRREERKNRMATLKDLFDYQKFADNPRIGDLIRETESRYGITEENSGADADPRRKDASSRQSLSGSELDYVNAAGIPDIWQADAVPDPEKKDMLWNRP